MIINFNKYVFPIFISVVIIIFISSCQFNKKTDVESRNNFENVFVKKNNFKKEDFIFLDFWNKMSSYEFNIIRDSLHKKNALHNSDDNSIFTINFIDSSNRDVGFSSNLENKQFNFILNPTFENDSLISINLDFSSIERHHEYDGDIMSGYENMILELYSNKFGEPEIQYPKGILPLKHIWKTGNKQIEIIMNYTKKYSELTKKYNDCLTYFSVFYQNLDLYNARNYKDKNNSSRKDNEAIDRAFKSYKDI